MHPHHQETVNNTVAHFEKDPKVLALLLTGSIAHGFERSVSDVDILIFLSDEDHDAHVASGEVCFFSRDLATYPEGYVDGKYQSAGFLRKVAESGSEPARYAFAGARVLFNRGIPDLDDLLRRAVQYPDKKEKEARMVRFRAQLEAWNWFTEEARQKGNKYLVNVAAGKLILFGGRLILAHNELLYPFHKWFLKVLETAPDKPAGLMGCIEKLTEDPSAENVKAFYELVKNFQPWKENPHGWGAQFMGDSELNWMSGPTPVDDL